jgi:hypothetical protein
MHFFGRKVLRKHACVYKITESKRTKISLLLKSAERFRMPLWFVRPSTPVFFPHKERKTTVPTLPRYLPAPPRFARLAPLLPRHAAAAFAEVEDRSM